MGLATRIIPTLLARGDELVKGTKFESWRSVGHAMQAVRIHNARGVDELILLDIGATPAGRGPDFARVEKLSDECFCPLTVGGGVRSVDDVRDLLKAGADKVAIGTAGLNRQKLIRECSDKFGRQAIVVAIDYRAAPCECKGTHLAVTSNCGRIPVTIAAHEPLHPLAWARSVEALGAGEILLTAVEHEGTLAGYDLPLIAALSRAVDVPIIAHGGCGTYEHMYAAIEAGASAVAAGAMFQFTDCTPRGAAAYLATKGVEVRL